MAPVPALFPQGSPKPFGQPLASVETGMERIKGCSGSRELKDNKTSSYPDYLTLTAETKDQGPALLCGHLLHHLSNKTQPRAGLLPHRQEQLQPTIALSPALTTATHCPREQQSCCAQRGRTGREQKKGKRWEPSRAGVCSRACTKAREDQAQSEETLSSPALTPSGR